MLPSHLIMLKIESIKNMLRSNLKKFCAYIIFFLANYTLAFSSQPKTEYINIDDMDFFLTESTKSCNQQQAPLETLYDGYYMRNYNQYLIDPFGRVTLLHGMNAVYKKPPYYPPDSANGFTEADADWLVDNGFNTLRIGTEFTGMMPEQPGVIDYEYFEQWDRIVNMLTERKIWILFDAHQDLYNEEFQGHGFPDWAVVGYEGENDATNGFPLNYLLSKALKRQYKALYNNENNIQDFFGQAWQEAALRWKDQAYNMGYDLINEPWPGGSNIECIVPLIGCPAQDLFDLEPFLDKLKNYIRQVDDKNIVWYEPFPTFDFTIPTALWMKHWPFEPIPAPNNENLGFSFHPYHILSSILGIPDAPLPEVSYEIIFNNAQITSRRITAPMIASEFGATDDINDITEFLREADENFVSWQYWNYKSWEDSTTTAEGNQQSMFEEDDDLDSVKIEKLKALSRVYPQYTNGFPTTYDFNPDNLTMYYSYKPYQTSAPTEIFVPKSLHYKQGYSVYTKGVNEITVSEDGKRLLIEQSPTTCEVEIELVPK